MKLLDLEVGAHSSATAATLALESLTIESLLKHKFFMTTKIRKIAVLGAGTMGARIAAHIANAGFPCVLLDMAPPGTPSDGDKAARNKIVSAGFDAAKKSKPAAFADASVSRFITIGNFDDDMKLLADCDWVIEAVAENL